MLMSCDLLRSIMLMNICLVSIFVFKQKTAYEMRISDWSSDVCSSDLPLTTDEGATAIEGPDVGVCLLCNVSHPERVVDPDNTQAGVINVGVGALNASRSIDVTAATNASYDVPFAAGSRPAFIISNAKIGRASCREGVCQNVWIWVGA